MCRLLQEEMALLGQMMDLSRLLFLLPTGLAFRGENTYIVEHPLSLDMQGAMRYLCHFKGLACFLSIWQGIARWMAEWCLI